MLRTGRQLLLLLTPPPCPYVLLATRKHSTSNYVETSTLQSTQSSSASKAYHPGLINSSGTRAGAVTSWLANNLGGATETIKKDDHAAESFSTHAQATEPTTGVQMSKVVTTWPHLW